MHIRGEWLLCDDGVVRPVIRGEVLAGDGSWQRVLFLVDTGADRTVLSSGALAAIGRQRVAGHGRLGGLGGAADSVVVETQIRLTREAAGKVLFRGQYFAVPEPEALDMSVLGRDITGLFAVIVDRPVISSVCSASNIATRSRWAECSQARRAASLPTR